jgi:6-phosphogluconolactonase (cycloisomerase 2 family)
MHRGRALTICGLSLFLIASVSAGQAQSFTGLALVDDAGREAPLILYRADVVISADGRNVYTVLDECCSTGHPVDVFARDTGGGLKLVQRVASGPDFLFGAHVGAIPGDGAHVYVGTGSEIGIFQRDPLSGELTHVGTVRDGDAGVEYLDGLRDMVLSPDGGHLYASSGNTDAITVFARNPGSGALSVVQVVVNGVGGVTGMGGVFPMAFSPDGAQLYVLGRSEDSMAVFDRDPGTGTLTFIETVPLGPIDDVSPAGVNVSPDGSHVYVDVFTPRSIYVLARATPAGTLTHVATQVFALEYSPLAFGPDPGVAYDQKGNVFRRDALTGLLSIEQDNSSLWELPPHALAVAPDGRNVYGVRFREPVRVLQRVDLRCSAAPLAGCRRPSRPGAGILKISRAAEALQWKWTRGETTTLADFGAPLAGDDYALCLYDAGIAPQPRAQMLLPADGTCGRGPCWRAKGTRGFKYGDRVRTPHGVSKAQLLAGASGAAKIVVKARGSNLPLPSDAFTAPVTVQLQRAGGSCWEAIFSAPIVNDADKFKSTSD